MNKTHEWNTTHLGLCDDIDATPTAIFQAHLAGCALKLVIAIHRTSNRRVLFRKFGMKAVARARTLTRTLYLSKANVELASRAHSRSTGLVIGCVEYRGWLHHVSRRTIEDFNDFPWIS